MKVDHLMQESALQKITNRSIPLGERRVAFSSLALARKEAKAIAHCQQMGQYIEALFEIAAEAGHPDRLAATAELIRVRQTFKTLASDIEKRLPSVLEEPLPDLGGLPDGRDREYLAMALSSANFAWIAGFCGQAAMAEETAERAREEFLVRLFEVSGLVAGFALLAANTGRMSLASENAADSAARRISRLFAAILNAASRLELRPVDGLATALTELVRRVFEGAGLPGAGAARHQALVQLVRIVSWGAHSRASLAVIPETYEPLKLFKRAYGSIGWDAKAKAVLAPVAEDLEDALVLQGRQGIASAGLVDQHRIVVGDPKASRQKLIKLADEYSELPENIRHWFRRGELREGDFGEGFGQGSLAALDLKVADALLAYTKAGIAPEDERALFQLAETQAALKPSLALVLRSALNGWQEMGVVVAEMAAMRELSLRGEVGAIEEFDPKYFDASEGVTASKMRIDRPAVVRRTASGADGACVRRGVMS